MVSLITIEVHARDVIEKLGKSNCTSTNDFEWVSQLRFYWDQELNDCVVKQVWGGEPGPRWGGPGGGAGWVLGCFYFVISYFCLALRCPVS